MMECHGRHKCDQTYGSLSQLLTAELAAHEETKRKLEALTQHYKIMRVGISLREYLLDDKQKHINSLEAKLKELQEQKPVAYSIGNTLHWHEGQGRTNAELYAYPIDVEALRQRVEKLTIKANEAEKWKGIATAQHGDGRTVQQIELQARKEENEDCAELCESNRLNDMTGKDCAAAIRARMK